MVTLPKVGDEIYVPSSFYISHGRDDVQGGKAIVARVEVREQYPEFNRYWVRVEELPGRCYNWGVLERDQEKLKERYGEVRAHPDPDNHPSSNTGAL